jgi:glycerol kinase
MHPKPGWVEHNPLEIWERTKQCIKELLEQIKVDPVMFDADGN